MQIIGIETEGLGTNNQMRGVIVAGARVRRRGEKAPVSREALLKAADGTLLHPKNFDSDEKFFKSVQTSVDAYLSENNAPDFVHVLYKCIVIG